MKVFTISLMISRLLEYFQIGKKQLKQVFCAYRIVLHSITILVKPSCQMSNLYFLNVGDIKLK